MTDVRVCGTCGRLGRAPLRDPMRTDEGASLGPCPGCADQFWLDPGKPTHRDYLAEADDLSRSQRVSTWRCWQRRLGVIGLLLAALALLAVAGLPLRGMTWRGHTHVVHVVGFMIIPLGVVAMLACTAWRQWRRAGPLKRPGRWSWGVRGRGRSVRLEGPLMADGQPLVAPLSGRACLAYEVGARADGARDGTAGSWLLLEHKATDVLVGRTRLRGEELRLDVRDRTPLDRDHGGVRDYLLARGIVPAEVQRVFETIVQADEPVKVSAGSRGPIRLRVAGDPGAPDPRTPVSWHRVGAVCFTVYLVVTVVGLMVPFWVGMLDRFYYGVGIKHMAGVFMTVAFGLPIVAGALGLFVRALDGRFSPAVGNLARLTLGTMVMPAWLFIIHWWQIMTTLWPFSSDPWG